MMRLARWTFSALCLLSLLACFGVAWLWWHSYRGRDDRLSIRLGRQMYVLRSDAGSVTAWGVPAGGDPVRQQALRDHLATLHNGDLRWQAGVEANHADSGIYWTNNTLFRPAELGRDATPDGGLARPLFDALDDPDRFAVAHAALATLRFWSRASDRQEVSLDGASRRIEARYFGLRVQLPAPDKPKSAKQQGEKRGWIGNPLDDPAKPSWFAGAAAGYDRSQMAGLRDGWFEKLATPVASTPDLPILFACTVLPLVWLTLRACRGVLRQRRQGQGLCPDCGYDLRATAEGGGPLLDRCPECGAVAAGETA